MPLLQIIYCTFAPVVLKYRACFRYSIGMCENTELKQAENVMALQQHLSLTGVRWAHQA